jgi:hypothetical protein
MKETENALVVDAACGAGPLLPKARQAGVSVQFNLARPQCTPRQQGYFFTFAFSHGACCPMVQRRSEVDLQTGADGVQGRQRRPPRSRNRHIRIRARLDASGKSPITIRRIKTGM